MTSNRVKTAARAYMDAHPGTTYQQALRLGLTQHHWVVTVPDPHDAEELEKLRDEGTPAWTFPTPLDISAEDADDLVTTIRPTPDAAAEDLFEHLGTYGEPITALDPAEPYTLGVTEVVSDGEHWQQWRGLRPQELIPDFAALCALQRQVFLIQYQPRWDDYHQGMAVAAYTDAYDEARTAARDALAAAYGPTSTRPSRLEAIGPGVLWAEGLAVGARHLLGTGAWGTAQYDALTGPYRRCFGALHPEDPQLSAS